MKSIRCASVVVVADNDDGLRVAARLRRMEMAEVQAVDNVDEAQRLCRAGGINACLVVHDEAVADARPNPVPEAPGTGFGVPSLMMVLVLTPHLRKCALRAGYVAAVAAGISPRMLYRRLGATLQGRRAAGRNRRPRSGIEMRLLGQRRPAEAAKPTLH